jgi:hypothetical protein
MNPFPFADRFPDADHCHTGTRIGMVDQPVPTHGSGVDPDTESDCDLDRDDAGKNHTLLHQRTQSKSTE